jgi:hypothetical protein
VGTPTKPPKVPFVALASGAETTTESVPIGSIVWRQGFVYRYLPPPWDQLKPLTLRFPPTGYKDKGITPAETIQIIGKPQANIPKTFSIDLGVADILISGHGKRIRYLGKGTETDIGGRIPDTVTGMSVGAPKSTRRVKYAVGVKRHDVSKIIDWQGDETLSELTGL